MTNKMNLVDQFVPNMTLIETFDQTEATMILIGRLDVMVDKLISDRKNLEENIANLKQAGISDAKLYWKDGKFLYLIHPMVNGYRNREYIGSDPTRVKVAMESVERYKDFLDANSKLAFVNMKLQRIISALKDLLEWL